MKIEEFLSPSNVALDVGARDKASVLKDLSSRGPAQCAGGGGAQAQGA